MGSIITRLKSLSKKISDNDIMDFMNVVKMIVSSKLFTGFVSVFTILYVGYVRPELPPIIDDLFNYPIFKVLVHGLIAYLATQNTLAAIFVAIAFYFTMNLLQEQKITEGFMNGLLKEGFFGNDIYLKQNDREYRCEPVKEPVETFEGYYGFS